jgi:hypothetical protein
MKDLHHPNTVPGTDVWWNALIAQRAHVIASDIPQYKKNTIARAYSQGDRRVRMSVVGNRLTGTNVRQQYVTQFAQGRNTNPQQYNALFKRIRQQFLSMVAQKS